MTKPNATLSAIAVISFCAAPFMSFAAANVRSMGEIYQELGFYFLFFTGLFLILATITWIIHKRILFARYMILCAIIFYCIFTYAIYDDFLYNLANAYPGVDWIEQLHRTRNQLILWFSVSALGIAFLYWLTARDPKHQAVCLVALSLLVVPTYTLVSNADIWLQGEAVTKDDAVSVSGIPAIPGDAPNVYYILPDMYPSMATLRDVFGFDNSEFYARLNDAGFRVSNKGYANYHFTRFSLSSTLSMDLLADPGYVYVKNQALHRDKLRGDALVPKLFKAHGYDFVLSQSNQVSNTCLDVVDHCIVNTRGPFNELLSNLLSLTPFFLTARVPYLRDTLQLDFTSSNAEKAARAAISIASDKKFVMMHLMLPHPPFIYRSDCSQQEFIKDDSLTGIKNLDRYKALFVEQVQCANQQLLAAVRTIQENDPNAIIVLQSDHGTHTLSLQTRGTLHVFNEVEFEEAFGVLSAFYLPPQCQDMHYDGITPVNTFRLIFNCLSGAKLDMVEDKSIAVMRDFPATIVRDGEGTFIPSPQPN